MSDINGFPRQRLSFKKKNFKWRKQCVDWADKKLTVNYNYIRRSYRHKKINFDLLNGIIHMSDMEHLINPEGIRADLGDRKIAHYPIMVNKLNLLRGEEAKRLFDFRVVITNPTSISEVEENKQKQLMEALQQAIESSATEEEYNEKLEAINDHFYFTWQDEREMNANYLVNHYNKEQGFDVMFNKGFVNAMAVAEEMYQCEIISGEPTINLLNPKKVDILKNGYSSRVEDADMIIINDYWSPGRVIDVYGEELSEKDLKYLEECTGYNQSTDSTGSYDERPGIVNVMNLGEEFDPHSPVEFVENFEDGAVTEGNAPFDSLGNIKVLRVYWKSLRYILKVKSYDPETGEEVFDFYTEDYIPDTSKGEEIVRKFTVNEAWEGTKIGDHIYVNMHPMTVQYWRMSNPSLCHFGIIGTIYNINEERSYSLVDMMKQYNYLYDIIHDRLNRLLARNWGKLLRLDASRKPGKWTTDKWMYFMQKMGIVMEDSFNAATEGMATGKLAAGTNAATTGVVDAELGNTIQQYINLLEFIKMEMSEVAGITKQREGQISNRETVGGVERATLQSSHITEWLFMQHDNLKKRVLECFLETAKAAFKGREKKFEYILPDSSKRMIQIDGDSFAEPDYGLVVDSSQQTQEFAQKMDMYAQAAMQNQMTSFSTLFKIYGTASLAEKQRIVEKDEREIQQRQQQMQQQQLQAQQQTEQMRMQFEQQKLALQDQMNQRDNETKLMIAAMSSQDDGIQEPEYTQEAKDKLAETIREFDAQLRLDRERLEFDKSKARTDARLKEKQINKKPAAR